MRVKSYGKNHKRYIFKVREEGKEYVRENEKF